MRDSCVATLRDSSPPCVTRRHLFSSLGFYERSASAACSRRAAHALRRLGFRFLKESESDLLDARSGLWSAAFASREESKSRLAARPPRRFFLVRCSDILSDSSPSTDRSPASLLPLACANTALCSRVHRAELQLLLRGPAKSTERKLRACHLLLYTLWVWNLPASCRHQSKGSHAL